MMDLIRSKLAKTAVNTCLTGRRIHLEHNKRCMTSTAFVRGKLPPTFTFIPDYFSLTEQCLLLRASLTKLDSMDRRQNRRRRKSLPPPPTCTVPTKATDLFLPDMYYQFEQGHYDGVIRNFRECHITTWPESEIEGLSPVLRRLYDSTPTPDTQTHILHLASDGEITPHVDNITASGTWIMGVSLGAHRILRLESLDGIDAVEILLPSGSLYIQQDDTRYHYKHSIVKDGTFHGYSLDGGQRISIMIRDLFRSERV